MIVSRPLTAQILSAVLLFALTAYGQDMARPPQLIHDRLARTDARDKVRRHSYCKVHEVKLEKGQTYTMELVGSSFDPSLRLEDAQGRLLGENEEDRIAGDCWLIFVPEQTDTYRLIATTTKSGQTGDYLLSLTRHASVKAARERQALQVKAILLASEGMKHQQRGEAVPSRRSWQQALEIRQKLYPKQEYPRGHPHLAMSLNGLGTALESQGEDARAADYFQQALDMLQLLYPARDYPEGHPYIAGALFNLGFAAKNQGMYTQARNYYQQAYVFQQKQYPETEYPHGHVNLARTLTNLGELLELQGEYGSALPYFLQALRMYQAVYPEQEYPRGHSEVAAHLISLGRLYERQGEHGKALPALQQAHAMCQKLYPSEEFPRGHPILAYSIRELGFWYVEQGEYARALPLVQQAVKIYQDIYPPAHYPQGHPILATNLASLGLLYDFQGEYKQAEHYLLQGTKMFRQLYPESEYPRGHPYLAIALSNLGGLSCDLAKYKQAFSYMKQAQEMLQQVYPEADYPYGHPERVQSLHNLGYVCELQNQHDKALDYYRRSYQMAQQLSEVFLGTAAEAEALNFLARVHSARDDLLAVSTQHLADTELYRLLWPGRSLLTRLIERRHVDLRASRDVATRDLAGKLQSVRERLAHRLLAPGSNQDRGREIEALAEEKEKLERRIAVKLRLAAAITVNSPKQLQAALDRKTIFIDFLRFGRFAKEPQAQGQPRRRRVACYAAFVVSPDAIQRVDLGEAAPIDKAIEDWRAIIQDGKPERIAKYSIKVRQLVWAPLAKKLPAETATIYLAPDGALTRLPWGAIPGDKEGTILLERHAFASVPHGPFLLQQLQRKDKQASDGGILLVGNVNYDSQAGTESTPAPLPQVAGRSRSPLLAEDKLWPALPGTAREIEKIAAALAADSITTLQGDRATAAAIQEHLPRVRIAHLATHGFFADKTFRSVLQVEEALFAGLRMPGGLPGERIGMGARNPLVLSGVVCAGANATREADRGILVADTIIGLDLRRLELAVLSACETGLGEMSGGEGVYGLTRAFHIAGCKNTIASLWRVDDEATAALMGLFYHNLGPKKLPPLEALRQAQLLLWRHPEEIPALAKLRGNPFARRVQLLQTAPPSSAPPVTQEQPSIRPWAAFVLSGVGR